MSDTIEKSIAFLNSLYGLPAAALVFGSCVVWGYILRFIKRFPNDGIPVAVVLWGGIVMSLVADSRASSMPLRVWVVRNIMVGLIIGLLAWLAHKTILGRIEDWISSKFNLQDTAFFKGKPDPGQSPPGPPAP